MERASADLVERIVITNDQGRSTLQQMTAMGLVQNVKRGGGKNTPKERQLKDVTILDVFQNAACGKIVASDWIDYLQMAKFNGRWVIVNVLWELKKRSRARLARFMVFDLVAVRAQNHALLISLRIVSFEDPDLDLCQKR